MTDFASGASCAELAFLGDSVIWFYSDADGFDAWWEEAERACLLECVGVTELAEALDTVELFREADDTAWKG